MRSRASPWSWQPAATGCRALRSPTPRSARTNGPAGRRTVRPGDAMAGLRIGLIGTGYIGRSHAIALSAVGTVFDDVEPPVLELVADVDEPRAAAARRALGFRRARRLARVDRRSGRRRRRRLHAQSPAPRDGAGRARCRQARLLRKAAGADRPGSSRNGRGSRPRGSQLTSSASTSRAIRYCRPFAKCWPRARSAS